MVTTLGLLYIFTTERPFIKFKEFKKKEAIDEPFEWPLYRFFHKQQVYKYVDRNNNIFVTRYIRFNHPKCSDMQKCKSGIFHHG